MKIFMSKVTIYSTPTCHYCVMAKKFFQDNKVEYTDINVAEDQTKAEEMVKKTGQMGVPVIIVEKGNEENIIVGFNQGEVAKLLNIS